MAQFLTTYTNDTIHARTLRSLPAIEVIHTSAGRHPGLPPELERYIFEMAARDGRKAAQMLDLMLVARRVHTWFVSAGKTRR